MQTCEALTKSNKEKRFEINSFKHGTVDIYLKRQ